jgi:hypothetical protein
VAGEFFEVERFELVDEEFELLLAGDTSGFAEDAFLSEVCWGNCGGGMVRMTEDWQGKL